MRLDSQVSIDPLGLALLSDEQLKKVDLTKLKENTFNEFFITGIEDLAVEIQEEVSELQKEEFSSWKKNNFMLCGLV